MLHMMLRSTALLNLISSNGHNNDLCDILILMENKTYKSYEKYLYLILDENMFENRMR
jgi:hypothetical protein